MKIIQQLDFLYIFAKMTVDEAFHYVFVDKKMKLFSMDTWSSETTENTLENVLDKLLCDSEIMANLTKTQDTYSKGLEEYLGNSFCFVILCILLTTVLNNLFWFSKQKLVAKLAKIMYKL